MKDEFESTHPKTKISQVSDLLHSKTVPFSENMCGPGGIFCARSGAGSPLPVPTDGPIGPRLTMCCCAVHSSTFD